jgi:hypothetical protein
MSERLANRLKTACRIAFVIGNLILLWIFLAIRDAEGPEDLPFDSTRGILLLLFATLAIGASLLLGTYMSFIMGVDVFGLNRLSRFPRGKPFDGLGPGEEERLRLRWRRGSLGQGARAGFKLLLTNRRLLAGSSLTSWYLMEIPLDSIRLIERKDPRWGPPVLRFHLLGQAAEHRDLTLGKEDERVQLEEELSRMGVPVVNDPPANST